MFAVLLIVLFIAYLYGVTKLLGLINTNQNNWYIAFNKFFCGMKKGGGFKCPPNTL